MASIKLSELSKKTNLQNPQGYTYIDLHFDVRQSNVGIAANNIHKTINGKDIVTDPDEAAIRNSLTNILNTRPGERFLIPKFGCNLLRYIGMPVNTSTGQMIGEEINRAITDWEPRVTIDKIIVISKEDDNEYDISINITIPNLKKRDIQIIGKFTSTGILDIRNI